MSIRSLTAPEHMAVNGHFASHGQNGDADFQHGVQVVDEDKEFKFVLAPAVIKGEQLTVTVPIWGNT